MSKFRIIPVLDILNSEVVHAKKGERTKYKPLKSKILDSSNPIIAVKKLADKFHFDEIYIADLDSIVKRKPNLELISLILKMVNIKVILDPGITNYEDIMLFSNFNLFKLIIGIETVENYDVIKDGVKKFGQNEIVLSIDMFQGKLKSKLDIFNPLELMSLLEHLGVKEIILLDLFRVGQKIGGIPPLYLKIREIFSGDILVGGGIKDFNDILNYKKNNFSGVLIGTAFYDGSIKIEEIKQII